MVALVFFELDALAREELGYLIEVLVRPLPSREERSIFLYFHFFGFFQLLGGAHVVFGPIEVDPAIEFDF